MKIVEPGRQTILHFADQMRCNRIQRMTKDSSPGEKIALFRSLFRGRDDIYPRRFVSRKTGKAGYSPVCGNEWVPGVCEKPRIKCSDCPNRRFLPVTNDVVRWHLSEQDSFGNEFVMEFNTS